MTYLFGDSSPSAIEINYIDFLGKALDCAIELLVADHSIARAAERARELEARTEDAVATITGVGSRVRSALEPICSQPADTLASDCANAIDRRATAIVREHVESCRASAAGKRVSIEEAREEAIARAHQALELLLLEYPLPGAVDKLAIRWAGKDVGYGAVLRAQTSYEVTATMAVSIPDGHRFGAAVRVGDLARELELHIPVSSGWLRKQEKSTPKRLGKLIVGEVTSGPAATVLTLYHKLDPTSQAFRVAIDRIAERVTISGHPDLDDDFDAEPADWAGFADFDRALRDATADLCAASLVEVQIDAESLASQRPRVLAARLIEAMAPTVDEIARRSSTPTELILRHKIEGDHRTEIFVTKAELAARLEALPATDRGLFDPLSLGPVGGSSSELEVELVVGEDSDSDLEPLVELSGEIGDDAIDEASG